MFSKHSWDRWNLNSGNGSTLLHIQAFLSLGLRAMQRHQSHVMQWSMAATLFRAPHG